MSAVFTGLAAFTRLIGRPIASTRGQATVELVGLVPLLVAIAAAVFATLAAGRASAAADAAAAAAAAAVIQGRDGEAAARRSLAGWSREATTIRVRDGRVDIRVRPSFPLLAGLLTASAHADAGQRPTPAPVLPIRGGDGASGAPAADPPEAPSILTRPAAPAPSDSETTSHTPPSRSASAAAPAPAAPAPPAPAAPVPQARSSSAPAASPPSGAATSRPSDSVTTPPVPAPNRTSP